MQGGPKQLTEREKEALRLIGRGHDAKSVARALDLSVHTVNERLRGARRKLAVSSSREAARTLLRQEEQPPQSLADKLLGEADGRRAEAERWWRPRLVLYVSGVSTMIIAAIALVLSSVPAAPDAAPAAQARSTNAEAEESARQWLALVDSGRWGESFDATAEGFKRINTNDGWTRASESGRVPLGPVRARMLLAQDDVPALPAGLHVVKFTTSFAAKPSAVETVSLVRERGTWRVVGYYID